MIQFTRYTAACRPGGVRRGAELRRVDVIAGYIGRPYRRESPTCMLGNAGWATRVGYMSGSHGLAVNVSLNDRCRSTICSRCWRLHALQKKSLAEQRAWLEAHPALRDHSVELHDFADTAALIASSNL